MQHIRVSLISHSPIRNAILGARTCWQSFHKDDYQNEENIGKNNEDLLRRLVQEYKHESVIEHVSYTFRIVGASRGFLQQLVRHRIASYSVQSTRYTLKRVVAEDLKNLNSPETPNIKELVEKYCVVPPSFSTEDYFAMYEILQQVFKAVKRHNNNDVAKYFIPEAWRTELVWTVNARELRHFLNLRLKPNAHFEIRHVANLVVKVLPKSHLILFEDLLEGSNGRSS